MQAGRIFNYVSVALHLGSRFLYSSSPSEIWASCVLPVQPQLLFPGSSYCSEDSLSFRITLLLQIDSTIVSLLWRDTCHMLVIFLSFCGFMNLNSIIALSHVCLLACILFFFHREIIVAQPGEIAYPW